MTIPERNLFCGTFRVFKTVLGATKMLATETASKKTRQRRRAMPDPSAFAFTIPDAQAMGAPGRTSIYTLIKDGKLKKTCIGGRVMIDGDSLRALLRGAE